MELRLLRYFVAVAEELHFGRAAARLGLAQPPLSQQIRRLEAELGVVLFRRTQRHVELTDAGEVFLVEARDILERVERAAELAQRAQNGEIGSLRIGFAGSATYHALPVLVRAYRERYPQVDVTLSEMTTLDQIDALHEGRIHAGFLRLPVSDALLDFIVMRRERFIVALPESHPLAALERVPLPRLGGEPFILQPRHHGWGYYDAIIAVCHAHGFSPLVRQEAQELHTIIGLVAAGLGVSLVPASARELRGRGVAYREIEGTPPMTEMALGWRRADPSPVLRSFIAVAHELHEMMQQMESGDG
ncbi:MAG TPA: LysR family transcriptional regulator [Ktedonobacterales bacterium]